MNPSLFKAYDIRGLYPQEIDAAAAGPIGRALAQRLGGGPVVVARDMRESGIPLRDALVAGLRAEGREVIDIGRVSTPILYFATTALGAAGGVMITASHNPGAYNGFKLCREKAIPIGMTSGLVELRDRALALEREPVGAPCASYSERSVTERYAAMLAELLPLRRGLREGRARHVVIDAGNGIAGEAIEPLLAKLPLEIDRLYFEPDGSFPNHEADPLKSENLLDLERAVRQRGADLGVAFDGDGDRAVFVDERGEPVPADLTTALFARALMSRRLLGAGPGAVLVFDLRSSRVVAEEIQAAGGQPLRSRVGHAFIKLCMREHGAVFGGELSGHYYFQLPGGYVADDGAVALLLMLSVLEAEDRPLSELIRPLRRFARSGELNRRVSDPAATLVRIRDAYPEGRADELDGLTVEYDDWWFNLRPSNTEPLLRLNVEARTQEELERRRDALLEQLGGQTRR